MSNRRSSPTSCVSRIGFGVEGGTGRIHILRVLTASQNREIGSMGVWCEIRYLHTALNMKIFKYINEFHS